MLLFYSNICWQSLKKKCYIKKSLLNCSKSFLNELKNTNLDASNFSNLSKIVQLLDDFSDKTHGLWVEYFTRFARADNWVMCVHFVHDFWCCAKYPKTNKTLLFCPHICVSMYEISCEQHNSVGFLLHCATP